MHFKYSNRDVPPCIDITSAQVTENGRLNHQIALKDNGIGFE
jgi:light-regulated signal transduction histidine kinase (bacteriophytochrome)